jgi:hypothetical protein
MPVERTGVYGGCWQECLVSARPGQIYRFAQAEFSKEVRIFETGHFSQIEESFDEDLPGPCYGILTLCPYMPL